MYPKIYKRWSASGEALIIPERYKSYLSLRDTEAAIKLIKDSFQLSLAESLNLFRVSAPISVLKSTGLNDNLSGSEKPVGFTVSSIDEEAEIVQSLAKWKRNALADYEFEQGEGLYTDMNALRPDEEVLDNLHSVYVDQWDWERIICNKERSVDFLKEIVKRIYEAIKETEQNVFSEYPELAFLELPDEIKFIHGEELLDRYPGLTPKEREDAVCEEYGAVFLIGIGADLRDGNPHDMRAADYDDWSTSTENGRKGLNGDILVWYPLLGCSYELSSMGIRVNKESLQRQLEMKDEMYKRDLYFHKRLIDGDLPLTIGGGIGQSRLCMLYLKKAFIGEVQASVWSDDLRRICRENGIPVL
ncbi:MAG: aspartate--ammonia ligase [bacterium]|nr:aspartate--ammonia ligase [bacterium]